MSIYLLACLLKLTITASDRTMSISKSHALNALSTVQMMLVAVIAAAIGWYYSSLYYELKAKYNNLKASRHNEQNIITAIFISVLATLGYQKAMKAYRKWNDHWSTQMTVSCGHYGPHGKGAKSSSADRGLSALGKKRS